MTPGCLLVNLYFFFRFWLLSLHRDTYYWYYRNPTLDVFRNSNQPTEWNSSYKTAAATISISTQLTYLTRCLAEGSAQFLVESQSFLQRTDKSRRLACFWFHGFLAIALVAILHPSSRLLRLVTHPLFDPADQGLT